MILSTNWNELIPTLGEAVILETCFNELIQMEDFIEQLKRANTDFRWSSVLQWKIQNMTFQQMVVTKMKFKKCYADTMSYQKKMLKKIS